jgi:hypothetical protein
MVLVTCNFRYLASAPKVRRRARAGAPALGFAFLFAIREAARTEELVSY